MGNRRFSVVATSDGDDESPHRMRLKPHQPSAGEENRSIQLRRKRMKLPEEEEEDEEADKTKRMNENETPKSVVGEEEQLPFEDAKPIGDVIRISGKGKGRRKHYESFEYDGCQFLLVSFIIENLYNLNYALLACLIVCWMSVSLLVKLGRNLGKQFRPSFLLISVWLLKIHEFDDRFSSSSVYCLCENMCFFS